MIRTNIFPIPRFTRPEHILLSTFNKEKLDLLVPDILAINPKAKFYSTGGTGGAITKILGSATASNYMPVEEFTGLPEMEGGLVKTLHPKIHAGLLAERNNPQHEKYLAVEMAKFGKGPGVYFDVFVGNLYDFRQAVVKDGGSAEVARCYIDIGGPCMTMAAAKNWHSVTALTSPEQYETFLWVLRQNAGKIPVQYRYAMALRAMDEIAKFRDMNRQHFSALDFDHDVLSTIKLVDAV